MRVRITHPGVALQINYRYGDWGKGAALKYFKRN